ncbi:DNA/RNA non-specific endonuclease [Gracilaria domingensis]|nr:DNA/RNA non-specific endonuclease [Gracilaria domingensis]
MLAAALFRRLSICLTLAVLYTIIAVYVASVVYNVKLQDIGEIRTWAKNLRSFFQAAFVSPKGNNDFERRYPVSEDDYIYQDCLDRNGVNLIYRPILNPTADFKEWKASSVRAIFRAVKNRTGENLADCGKTAYNYDRPPGWLGPGMKCTRGHLLGRQLGGNGLNTRNIVMLFSSANSPVMSGWENIIAEVRKKFLINSSRKAEIEYVVKAEYCPGRETPAAVWMETWFAASENAERFEWLKILVPNEQNVKAYIYMDNSMRLGFGQLVINPNHNAIISGELARSARPQRDGDTWKKYPRRLVALAKRSTKRARKWRRRQELTPIAVQSLAEDSPCKWELPDVVSADRDIKSQDRTEKDSLV